MKKFPIAIIGAFVSIICLSTACSQAKKASVVERTLKPSGQTSKVTIHGKVGDTLVLKLESNPSTGFDWEYEKPSEQVLKVLEQSSEDIEKRKDTDIPIMGAPKYNVYKFVALKTGDVPLAFKYLRAWEKEVAPVKVQKIIISIK